MKLGSLSCILSVCLSVFLSNEIKNQHNILQSPAVDVVGIGTASGRIIIHNIRLDETLMSFTQDWGPISTLAFRTGDVSCSPSLFPSLPAMHSDSLSASRQTVLPSWRLGALRATLPSGIWSAARWSLSRDTRTGRQWLRRASCTQSRC